MKLMSMIVPVLLALPIGNFSPDILYTDPESVVMERKELEKDGLTLAARKSNTRTYEVTAYTSGPESTGKRPGDPGYGITASGARVQEGKTIACPPDMPFGTKVYIPHFGQTFVCQDRGGAIKGDRLDVYMKSLREARKFGRRSLEVEIYQ